MSTIRPPTRDRRANAISRRLLLAFLLVSGIFAGQATGESLLVDNFEQGLGPHWEEKSFRGHTTYQVVSCDGDRCLRAESRGAASGLIRRLSFDPRRLPILTWRWKVDNLPAGGDERSRRGDDYAARIYVVFPHWFFPKTRTINYIWANRLPRGESLPNPFTANAMMLAVQSGGEQLGRWLTERRNIVEDYRRLFGEEPPEAGAIALMTDTDNTGASAIAYYDDIRLESESGGGE